MKRTGSHVLLLVLLLNSAHVAAQGASPQVSEQANQQALLKRIYAARMQLEQERARNDNEARANAPLIRQGVAANDATPTVRQMRRDMATTLARYEQNFRCLDVDVDNQGGNTVVICGSNSGDISGENVSAGRDLINPRGQQ